MSNKRIALIGDIIGSRQIKARDVFDDRLSSALQILNRQHGGLLSPYTVTIGDEIQALFSSPENIFYDTVAIQAAIYPHKMRFSIGMGELVTPVNPLAAIGMDGPAFHLARAGIELLKKNSGLYVVQGDLPDLELINAGLALISHTMSRWKLTRWQVLTKLMPGIPVKETAASLGISEQAVYKNIRSAALDKISNYFLQTEKILAAALRG